MQTATETFTDHPLGTITTRGVVDIGRACSLGCSFCYYAQSPMKGLESEAEIRAHLEHLASIGKTHTDWTGGEPTLHPKLPDLVAYARSIGILSRIITVGVYLRRKQPYLMDRLLDAGLSDFLLSTHGTEEAHNAIVQSPFPDAFWDQIRNMEHLRSIGFSFCVNTVVIQANLSTIVDLAHRLAEFPVRIWNLIDFNAYYRWNDGRPDAIKERYDIQKPIIQEAIDVATAAGIAVNLRYVPMCSVDEPYRKHVVGIRGYQFDPYEWDQVGETPETFAAKARQRIEQSNKFHVLKCMRCRLRPICDGVNAEYVKRHGWDEFSPVTGEGGSITDVNHYRRENLGALRVKA